MALDATAERVIQTVRTHEILPEKQLEDAVTRKIRELGLEKEIRAMDEADPDFFVESPYDVEPLEVNQILRDEIVVNNLVSRAKDRIAELRKSPGDHAVEIETIKKDLSADIGSQAYVAIEAGAKINIRKQLEALRGDPSKKPEISVVIPAHNEQNFIFRALASIALQELDPSQTIEVIVVDNNSSEDDLTSAIAKGLGVKVVNYGSDRFTPDLQEAGFSMVPLKGVSGARNVGLFAAQGKYLVNTDADAISTRSAFRNLVARLQDEKVGVVVGNPHNYKSELVKGMRTMDKISYLTRILKSKQQDPICIIGQLFACRVEEALDAGGYNTVMAIQEDVDVARRIMKTTEKLLAFAKNAEVAVSPRRYLRENAVSKFLVADQTFWEENGMMTSQRVEGDFSIPETKVQQVLGVIDRVIRRMSIFQKTRKLNQSA